MLVRVEELHEDSPRDRALALMGEVEKGKKHSISTLKRVRDGLVECLKAELDELCAGEDERMDIDTLSMSLNSLMSWWQHESTEGEVAGPFPKETNMGDTPEVTKADVADVPEVETPKAVEPEVVKAETPDIAKLVDEAVTKALEVSGERVKALETQIEVLKGLPQTGGPVLTRTAEQQNKADEREARDSKIRYFKDLAKTVSDPALANAYREQVSKLEMGI